jgi:hypothetical protein
VRHLGNGTRVAALAALMAVGAATAAAQGLEGTTSVFAAVGTGVSLGGNVIEEGAGRVDGIGVVFVEQAFSNHYSDGLRLRGGVGFGLDYNKELFVNAGYGRLNATERVVGAAGAVPLSVRFSNARALDVEGGLRYYFLPEGPTRTYVAGVAGVRFLEEVTATLRAPDVGLQRRDLPYFEASTLFVVGADAGVSREVAEGLSIGVELGIRFQPGPTPAEILAGSGLEDINDTGSRWSLPIGGFATWRF